MVQNIRYGQLSGPLIPIENGSHQTVRGIANTTTGLHHVLAKRIPHHELVREVLCSLLAQAVDLPSPVPFVLDVRESSWSEPEFNHAFGTLLGRGRSLVRAAHRAPATLDSLVKWPKFLVAIAFDEWIANADRTESNLLFIGRRDFQLIDHGEALPSGIGPDTKLVNRLARHLAASSTTTHPRDLSRRVLASCSDFGKVNFGQIKVAAMAGAWAGQTRLDECIRLLTDRLTHLPMLIEEEFRVNQAQLLG